MKVFGLEYEQVIQIGEHTITLPDPPTSPKEILFYDKSEEEAYWQRDTSYPEIWYSFVPHKTFIDQEYTKYDDKTGELVQLSVQDTITIRKIYEDTMRKRVNGVFMKNKNRLVYLPGPYWFMLQWCKMFGAKGDGFGKHFRYQREIFYLFEHMWHPKILGIYISKAKKTGITQIIDGGYCVEKATRESQWIIGFMSRNFDVAVENNMKLFLYAFDNLPGALKPMVGAKAAKGGNVEFSNPAKVKKAGDQEVLETKVFCVPTSEHSFDSHFMNLEHIDEYPKYYQDSKKEPREVFNGNKAGVKDQDEFRGRIIISSYPPEVDDIGSEQAAKTYKDSKLSTCKNGKTISELICYHIPAYKSLKSCIDKYGDCDEEKAKQIILENRERVIGDKKAYLAEVRQNPNNEKEAFGSGGASKCFNPVRLTELQYDLSERQASGKTFRQGKLIWDNPLWEAGKQDQRPKGKFCNIKFIEFEERELHSLNEDQIASKTRYRIYHDIPEIYKNQFLRLGRDDAGNLLPPSRFYSVGAIDPTDYRSGEHVEQGSKISMHSMPVHDLRHNMAARRVVTKVFNAEYYYRPENPQESYEDCVKHILYTGSLCIVEANNAYVAQKLIEDGLSHYMLWRDENNNLVQYNLKHKDKLKPVRTLKVKGSIDTVADIVTFTKAYLLEADPNYNEVDYGALIESERLIGQYLDFDDTDTKKYDMVISSGYTLIAHEAYQVLLNTVPDDDYQAHEVRSVLSALSRL